MSEEKKDEKKVVTKVLEINYKTMNEGTCRVENLPNGEKWAICKDKGKIKIYPIKEEKKES